MKQASLDSQGEDDCEIVPMELPYPEETQIWEGKNESVRSRQFCSFCSLLPPIFHKQRLDAIVTV